MKYLFLVPDYLELRSGLRWAMVHSLGGDHALFVELEAVTDSMFDPTAAGQHQDFWCAAVSWLMHHREQISTREDWCNIYDYALHLHTERLIQGKCFRWRGRTPEDLLRRGRAYKASRLIVTSNKCWEGRGWDWEGALGENGRCTITELTSPQALLEEGRLMDHCVASYVSKCQQNLSAIFSLSVNGERRLTIEVDPADRTVRQAYGGGNRAPTAQEENCLDFWTSRRLSSFEV